MAGLFGSIKTNAQKREEFRAALEGPAGLSNDHIRKAEKTCQAGVLLSCIHHTDMGNEVPADFCSVSF